MWFEDTSKLKRNQEKDILVPIGTEAKVENFTSNLACMVEELPTVTQGSLYRILSKKANLESVGKIFAKINFFLIGKGQKKSIEVCRKSTRNPKQGSKRMKIKPAQTSKKKTMHNHSIYTVSAQPTWKR